MDDRQTDADLTQALEAFLEQHPAYEATRHIDTIRATQFRRLKSSNQIYLDYTGAALYSETMVEKASQLLRRSVLANPHSRSTASTLATDLVEQSRDRVLEHFRADPAEYCVVFTSNASGAAKLVGESFPFGHDGCFAVTEDNHNSIVGIAEFAKRARARVEAISLDSSLRLNAASLDAVLRKPGTGGNLLAYPAQSNYSGVQHGLELLDAARRLGWQTLLDAAAYAPTNELDLSVHKPDFVCLSFYKIFGYPTGVGCLLARRERLAGLVRPWYSGGTVVASSFAVLNHVLSPGESAFEDGTLNYACIPALTLGFDLLEEAGVAAIRHRVCALTSWLITRMLELEHENGTPVIHLYGPPPGEGRGGTIAFAVRDPMGMAWEPQTIELLANEANIAIRTGHHCNPGANERALRIDIQELEALYRRKAALSVDEFLWENEAHSRGVVRASLGMMSDFSDVFELWRFLRQFCDRGSLRSRLRPS